MVSIDRDRSMAADTVVMLQHAAVVADGSSAHTRSPAAGLFGQRHWVDEEAEVVSIHGSEVLLSDYIEPPRRPCRTAQAVVGLRQEEAAVVAEADQSHGSLHFEVLQEIEVVILDLSILTFAAELAREVEAVLVCFGSSCMAGCADSCCHPT
jgi:hypothetical protein